MRTMYEQYPQWLKVGAKIILPFASIYTSILFGMSIFSGSILLLLIMAIPFSISLTVLLKHQYDIAEYETTHAVVKRLSDSYPVFAESEHAENLRALAGGEYIYVIQDVDVSGYCKIGKTNRPFRRMRTFDVKLPFRIHVVHVIAVKDRHLAERWLHTHFSDKRIRGEWFKLSQSDIDYIKSL